MSDFTPIYPEKDEKECDGHGKVFTKLDGDTYYDCAGCVACHPIRKDDELRRRILDFFFYEDQEWCDGYPVGPKYLVPTFEIEEPDELIVMVMDFLAEERKRLSEEVPDVCNHKVCDEVCLKSVKDLLDETVSVTPSQLQAAEEACCLHKCKHEDLDFHRVVCPAAYPELITAVASLLAEREAKARREGGEKVAKAVEEAKCNNVYHTEDAKKYRADGYCNFCYAAKTAARQALKDL